MTAEIDRVSPVLSVSDVKEAIEWYDRALGFTPSFVNREEGDGTGTSWNYALLDNNDIEIHLGKRVTDDQTVSSPSNCYMFVRNINTLHAHLLGLNADVSELTEMPWGNVECWLHDPYGNRLVLSAPA